MAPLPSPISKRNRSAPPVASPSVLPRSGIVGQLTELRDRLRSVVANGLFSERSLANAIGMSQPHVHHLLSGDRSLTASVADLILARLAISPAELLDKADLDCQFQAIHRDREPKVAIPLLSGKIGPRGPHPDETQETCLVDYHLLAGVCHPVIVALGLDPALAAMLHAATHAILDESDTQGCSPTALYAVEQAGVVLARGVRPGRNCSYLLAADNWNEPTRWQRVPHLAAAKLLIPVVFDRNAFYAAPMPASAAAS